MNNSLNQENLSKIKLTTARRAILDLLQSSTKPFCYEDIKDKISMDKATFYRNITIFEEENLINSFESNDKKRYFEIKDKKHLHFICDNCSNIECIFEKPDFLLKDYKIENIILKGKCKECNKNG
ncbi:Fur family transcriptional regulator [Aliarcobacter cryaerophilus]|uniref:Fur family transcriptional regulator n=1 Tax=Aliarcobacter cryaerophilus TaxID=28198 RepID=UPI003DA344FD